MSTRKILKDRKKFFEHIIKKDPLKKESLQKVVDEIIYILNCLKEYDKKNNK